MVRDGQAFICGGDHLSSAKNRTGWWRHHAHPRRLDVDGPTLQQARSSHGLVKLRDCTVAMGGKSSSIGGRDDTIEVLGDSPTAEWRLGPMLCAHGRTLSASSPVGGDGTRAMLLGGHGKKPITSGDGWIDESSALVFDVQDSGRVTSVASLLRPRR